MATVVEEDKYRKGLTFLSSEPIRCPVCGMEFYIEKMQTGGGRLIAGDLTDFLHRKYKPGEKFGKFYPLAYSIIVCPDCYYAAMPYDFLKVPPETINILKDKNFDRIDLANKLIGEIVDFSKARTLETGAVSYVLAIESYDSFNKKFCPVIKQAICSMRAAYLFEELNIERPGVYFDYLAEMFYKKALFFYKHALELNQTKEQILENVDNLGPDIDKNYGFDGITYLIGALLVKYGDRSSKEVRIAELDEAKLYFGKIFGMGKADMNKPKEILEKSKLFYEEINKEMKELQG